MKKTVLLFLSCFFLSISAQAQDDDASAQGCDKLHQELGVTLGGLDNFQIFSIHYQHSWWMGKRGRWRLGYGLRFSTYYGSDIEHTSAPPDFYGDAATEDTLLVEEAQMANLSLTLAASYFIKEKWELGFNIDALGLTMGGDQSGVFTQDGNESFALASPKSITALLVGPNDIGMLKAEFFAGYQFNPQWRLRLGVSSLYTEYRTRSELQVGNDRFRAEGFAPLISATYTFP